MKKKNKKHVNYYHLIFAILLPMGVFSRSSSSSSSTKLRNEQQLDNEQQSFEQKLFVSVEIFSNNTILKQFDFIFIIIIYYKHILYQYIHIILFI